MKMAKKNWLFGPSFGRFRIQGQKWHNSNLQIIQIVTDFDNFNL